MTFSVRKAITDADLASYPFEDADGVARELPHAKLLSPRQAFRVLADGDLGGVLKEVGTDPTVADAIMDLPSHVVELLIRDWFEHSDVQFPGGEPGKSEKPSPSSVSTATRSKPTSRSGASRSRG